MYRNDMLVIKVNGVLLLFLLALLRRPFRIKFEIINLGNCRRASRDLPLDYYLLLEIILFAPRILSLT